MTTRESEDMRGKARWEADQKPRNVLVASWDNPLLPRILAWEQSWEHLLRQTTERSISTGEK